MSIPRHPTPRPIEGLRYIGTEGDYEVSHHGKAIGRVYQEGGAWRTEPGESREYATRKAAAAALIRLDKEGSTP